MKTLTLLLSVISFASMAQKLPGVQPSAGLRAPAKVSIDGNSAEWTFQAYNKATGIFYTLANDREYLYLVVQSSDERVTEKIMAGGITLSLKGSGQPVTITYPVLPRNMVLSINRKWNDQFQAANEGTTVTDTTKIARVNAQFVANAKEIGVTGIKGINDTLVSIYNEWGVKPAAKFDPNNRFTYELAIPLKYFGGIAFKYNIKLNGLVTKDVHIHSTPAADAFQQLTSPTDLSGDYNLVPNLM